MEFPIYNTFINFSHHHFCCFTIASLFVLDKSTAWNKCLQHPCFKKLCKIAQASENSDSNTQQFLLDLLTHSWIHSMLFALPGYQFPYTVMNMCFYLMMDYVRDWASPAHEVHNIMWLSVSISIRHYSLERKVQAVHTRCQDGYMPCTYHELLAVTCKACHFPALKAKLWSLKGKYDRQISSQFHKSFVTDDPTKFIVSVRAWFSYWVLRGILFLCRLSLLYEKQKHESSSYI
jgi:hypothetical protein